MQLEDRQIQIDESEDLGSGMRRDTMTINMGPQHPSTHGVLRLILTLDGETIIKAEPDIGYLHTGIEKTAESKSYFKALVVTDRMDYLAPLCNNLGYSLAVEKLLGIEVPERAMYARVILGELQRIASHLVWLGSSALDLGAQSVFLYCFREREIILDIFELCSGVRMMTSYIMPGGIQADLPPEFERRVRDFLGLFPSRLREYHDLLTNNRLWLDRTRGIAILSAADAIKYGCSGATLREAASPMTCASSSRTPAMTASTLTSRSGPTATSMTATWYGCWRWNRVSPSSGRRWMDYREEPGR